MKSLLLIVVNEGAKKANSYILIIAIARGQVVSYSTSDVAMALFGLF